MPEDQRRCRSRSRSPGPSLRPRRDYVAAPSSAVSSTSRVPHSRPSSRPDMPQRRANATANNVRPCTPGRHVYSENSTDLPSLTSQPFTQPGISDSTLAQMVPTSHSVAQHTTPPPYLPNHQDSTQITQSPNKNTGMFNQAHKITVTGGTFVDGNVTYNDTSSNQFMEKLLNKTIRGAEFDSSDRDPPPRCLPGTRLAVRERCVCFISNCDGVNKMRWVFGCAGVGKSAVMQSVAESPDLPAGSPASVFFSTNGRSDGTKAIMTLSYQLAARSDTYRQFNKLIVNPFIHNPQLNSAGRVSIIIDGLDECKDHRTQLELLRLISDLCLTYPSSPLVWLIASRPEPHITSFFSKSSVIPAYEKEEIPVNSDEARADVERFLRTEFTEIKEGSDSLDPRWPNEQDFWKVADAAGGLFAYAQTVIKYIGDSAIGSPALQLSDVLDVIDLHMTAGLSREEHPMALLDALYERILSKVSSKIMPNTRKLLLMLASGWTSLLVDIYINPTFVKLCNWLGMTADEAYAALHHLRSILSVPRRDEAHKEEIEAFHKSFFDYIRDYTRSRFSPDFRGEFRQLETECVLRVLNETLNGISRDHYFTDEASDSTTPDKISLTWPIEEAGGDDYETRLDLDRLAIYEVEKGLGRKDPVFQSERCIRLLVTDPRSFLPYDELIDVVFDDTRRLELMTCGILKEIPLLEVATIPILHPLHPVRQFRHPATLRANSWDRLYPLYCHERKDAPDRGLDDDGKVFRWDGRSRNNPPGTHCVFYLKRLKDQLKNWTTGSPDETALVLFTASGECCIQVRLVDPEDCMSEWTYTFWVDIPLNKRKKYGSLV